MKLASVQHLEERKARGAFFTPPEIAAFVADWAIRGPTESVLEPSCGEAAFLTASLDRFERMGHTTLSLNQLHGCDIDAHSVEVARQLLGGRGASATLKTCDFFEYSSNRRFDVVLGNPPYVRYQSFTGDKRRKGFEAALAQGVRLPGLASSWAAFTIHAASFLQAEGRLALVLPAELLSVNYAGPVRRYLMNRFRRVSLVLFEQRVFPGVLEEIVLLLAEGEGPTDHFELVQCRNLADLNAAKVRTWQPPPGEGRWITGLLSPDAQEAYQRVLAGGDFETLSDWGDVTLGMVTGNNGYFTLTAAKAHELQLPKTEMLPLCPPGSRHLRGLVFGTSAWRDMLSEGSPCYLFDPDVTKPSRHALAYIADGEKRGVDTAYKCRVRSPWWKVPRVPRADALLIGWIFIPQ